MNYFESNMSNSTNTAAQFDEKRSNLSLRLWQDCTQFMQRRLADLYFTLPNSSRR